MRSEMLDADLRIAGARGAEIEFLDIVARGQLGGRPGQRDPTVLEHVGVMRISQREVGVLLGQQKAHPSSRLSWPMISKISSTMIGASPIEGSSSRTRVGRVISARPMATICCSPPEVDRSGSCAAPSGGETSDRCAQAVV